MGQKLFSWLSLMTYVALAMNTNFWTCKSRERQSTTRLKGTLMRLNTLKLFFPSPQEIRERDAVFLSKKLMTEKKIYLTKWICEKMQMLSHF